MDPKNPGHKNRLAAETSLYLRQHSDNPVDWYPWGEEALERAKRENKPVLLSIGYSACHWCHVMAHESFEDPATAELMNQLYVNIKVDREERPDLDKIYQLAHYAITQRGGGWPLTMFLTPDQVPIFGGTYFPIEARYGLPGFKEILQRVSGYIREHPVELKEQSESVARFLHNLQHTVRRPEREPGEHLYELANTGLLEWFDADNGGFGAAPKFPHTISLDYALRQWRRLHRNKTADGNGDAAVLLQMVTHSLNGMAKGGVYDHLGGGFFRYSVDAQWMIPHFEKMLYDNALLLDLYVSAWQAQPSPLYEQVIRETAGWVIHHMQSPEGGFYSTLDADSEGVEGKYYVWEPAQVQALLGEAWPLFAEVYGLNKPANFEQHHWHLHLSRDPLEVAAQLGLDAATAEKQLDKARALLLQTRHQRVAPGRDEKILSSWNALMIKALFRAGRAFGRPDWIEAAEDALAFVRTQLWDGEILYAVYGGGYARLPAYLDDYAFLLDAVMHALHCRWRNEDLQFAFQLADRLLDHFEDRENGGFYFTPDTHETLIFRPKPKNDESTPPGGAVAVFALQRLAQLTESRHHLGNAEHAIQAAAGEMEAAPMEHCAFLVALEEHLYPPDRVILRGDAVQLQEWQARLAKLYLPATAVYAIDSEASGLPKPVDLPAPDTGVTAYICQGTSCSAPILNIDELIEALNK
jgi:uncharacterized protein YyaL (SSP411 family)